MQQYQSAENSYKYVLRCPTLVRDWNWLSHFSQKDFCEFFSDLFTKFDLSNIEAQRAILSQLYLYEYESFRTYIMTLDAFPAFIQELSDNFSRDAQLCDNAQSILVKSKNERSRASIPPLPNWAWTQAGIVLVAIIEDIMRTARGGDYDSSMCSQYVKKFEGILCKFPKNSYQYAHIEGGLEALEGELFAQDLGDEDAMLHYHGRVLACIRSFPLIAKKQTETFVFSDVAQKSLEPFIKVNEYKKITGNAFERHLYKEAATAANEVGKVLAQAGLSVSELIDSQWTLFATELARALIAERSYVVATKLLDVSWALTRGLGRGLGRTALTIISVNTALNVALAVFCPKVLLVKVIVEIAITCGALVMAATQIKQLAKAAIDNPLEALAEFTALVTQLCLMSFVGAKVAIWLSDPNSFLSVWGERFRKTTVGQKINRVTDKVDNAVAKALGWMGKHAGRAAKWGYGYILKYAIKAYRKIELKVLGPDKIIERLFKNGECRGWTKEDFKHAYYGDFTEDGFFNGGMHTNAGLQQLCEKFHIEPTSLESVVLSNGVKKVYLPKDIVSKKALENCKELVDGVKTAYKTILPDKLSHPSTIMDIAEEIIANPQNLVKDGKYCGLHSSSGIWFTVYTSVSNAIKTIYPNQKV